MCSKKKRRFGRLVASEFDDNKFCLMQIPFGIIVRCPTCMVAVAVAQPQDGTQVWFCRSIL